MSEVSWFFRFQNFKKKHRTFTKVLGLNSNFPEPKSITEKRSWFGLIYKVFNYAKLYKGMVLFRDFLSSKHKFILTENFNQAFNESKEMIVNAIKTVVQTFDLRKLTSLGPDWSKQGLGYFLMQKHCNCNSLLPDCCTNGWKVTLAGSKFLNGLEKN